MNLQWTITWICRWSHSCLHLWKLTVHCLHSTTQWSIYSLRDRKQKLKRVNIGLRWTLPSVFWGDCVFFFFLAACGVSWRPDLWWHTSNGRRYKQRWSQFLSREEWWGYFVQLWIPFYISSYICMYSIFALSALRSGDSAAGVNMRDDGGIRIENYFCDWHPTVVILDSSFVGSVMPLVTLLTL